MNGRACIVRLALGMLILSLQQSASAAKNEETCVKGKEVLDGDTILVEDKDGMKFLVRLAQVDAPELLQPFGRASCARLTALAQGKELVLLDRHQVEPGVESAVVWRGDVEINSMMLQEGLVHIAGDRMDASRIYCDLEEYAKKRQKGVWSVKNLEYPESWRKTMGKERVIRRVRSEDSVYPNLKQVFDELIRKSGWRSGNWGLHVRLDASSAVNSPIVSWDEDFEVEYRFDYQSPNETAGVNRKAGVVVSVKPAILVPKKLSGMASERLAKVISSWVAQGGMYLNRQNKRARMESLLTIGRKKFSASAVKGWFGDGDQGKVYLLLQDAKAL